MSTSVSGREPCSCNNFSIPQLLRAAKVKLRDSSFRGTVTTTMNKVEVALLEQDVLEILSFVRSMRNKSAPINRIPGEILSLVPRYLKHQPTDKDEDFIALTHVCHGWRQLFISHPSLWTRLDFTNVDKTRTFIERSKSMPLDIIVRDSDDGIYVEEAFVLAVPHVRRFRSLTIGQTSSSLRNFTTHIMHHMPLLEEVTMYFTCDPAPSLIGIYGGDLPWRTLKLTGVVTNLPWGNMRNLTTFELRCPQRTVVTAAELLDFLKSAPNLEDITLEHSISPSPKASSSQLVYLYQLKKITIVADQGRAALIYHLFIPERASLTLEFGFSRNKSPFPSCVPRQARNLNNLSRITTVNLRFARAKKFVRLAGPSGELKMFGYWEHEVQMNPSPDLDRRILHSLSSCLPLGETRRLTISEYDVPTPGEIDKSPVHGILLRMLHLRTLQLVHCNNLPFILALNPTSSSFFLCPYLEELIIYSEGLDEFDVPELVRMAKERASRGAKLWSVKIIGPGVLLLGREVSELREHVTHVEHMLVGDTPEWDSGPDDEGASGVLTPEQMRALVKAFDGLGGQRLTMASGIILSRVPNLMDLAGEKFELKLDILPPKILIDLYSFLIRPLRTV